MDATLARLVGDYTDAHGYAPDRVATATLARQAVLMERPASEQRSWAAEREQWLARAAGLLGVSPEEVSATVVAATVGKARPLPVADAPSNERAELVVARLEERAATWNRRDIEREAAAELREAGVRVDDASVSALARAVEADADSVSLAVADVGGQVPDVLRRADGMSVFARRGEQLFTSRAIIDAERELAELAAVRSPAPAEKDRRLRAGWSMLEDDDLVRRVAGAETQIATLEAAIAKADVEAPGIETAAADARSAAANVREQSPASAAVRAEVAAEDTAAVRVAEIEARLAVHGLHGPRKSEQVRLRDEALRLRHAHPAISLDPRSRAESAAERLRRARANDMRAVDEAEKAADKATVAARRHATNLTLLVGARAEQVEGRDALAEELKAREAMTGRVSMSAYLDGLGVDQAAAMVRLADPSSSLSAMIGPAGSGKTTALAALVRAHTDAGRSVHVLAPTAVAASGLGEAVGVPGQTVAKALWSWDRGMGLPGPGDLILIDEASMATTLDVRDVVRVGREHKALVRLIGDPRQAKAVGAGGALDIVARAGNAPELSELHRFSHAWEADATLRLRAGDPSVIDVYDAHDRIREGSYAQMLEETYRAYRDATATDPSAAVMIVSDNLSVQALSERARADRVADGRVEASGVELHDGSVAGVGDLIVTRRNDRRLRTGPGDAAFVKNRDRWEVTSRNHDGSLTVRRVDSDQTTSLPADYVADHVELSYALTGYGAQGITVAHAFALVQPGDERSFAYVATSRGADTNMVRVVTATLDDEPGGHHPQRSARDILSDVLANEPAVSAGEALDAAVAHQYDAAELFSRHRHTTRTLAEQTLAGVLDARGVPELLEQPDAWRLIEQAELATERGLDLVGILFDAPDDKLVDVASATSMLFAARYFPVGELLPYPTLVAGLVPATPPSTRPDVAAYLDGLAAGVTRSRADLAADYQTGPPPAWAKALGTPPTEPDARARWANAVAGVALWREAHGITSDGPIGRVLPPGHRDGPARARAAMAAAEAVELTGGKAPDRTPAPRYDGRDHLSPTPARAPDRGPRLSR